MITDHLLEVMNLSVGIHFKGQDIPILKSINFSLKEGETLALVGESGSGKSMTALAIMQLLPPGAFIDPSSSIFLKRSDLLTYSELEMRKIRGKKIALIFQEAITALNPVLTIGEQIIEVIQLHTQLGKKAASDRALFLLEEVGIPDPLFYFKAYPYQLSGGLKQRAMIAMALAVEPSVLIADEPTTALDVTLQAQIIHLLKEIQQKYGMSLIFITHDLGVVYEIADKVVVLYKGEVIETDPASVFFNSPKHPYVMQLFSSLPGWLEAPSRPSKENPKSLLEVKDLKIFYPIKKGLFKRTVGYIKAVNDINLTIKSGKTLALVGESGSGKTTTGMALLRLIPITSGQIIYDGKNLATLRGQNLRHFRKKIQVVFQDPYGSMNPRLMIRDIISEGTNQKASFEEREKYIDDLLLSVGLDPEAKDRYPHEFSGGQRQRICIARALAPQPDILICDEPTSALDVSAQMQILTLLLKLQVERDLSYLLITHNIAVVSYMADEVAVMHKGIIVEMGEVHQVLHHPQQRYTQRLLNAVPRVPKLRNHHL